MEKRKRNTAAVAETFMIMAAVLMLPLSVSCSGNMLEAEDSTFSARIHMVTPEVSNGGNVSVRIEANRERIEIGSYECEYGLFSGGEKVLPHTPYTLVDGHIDLTSGPVSTDRDRAVRIEIAVTDPEDGRTILLSGEFDALAQKVEIPGSISFSEDHISLCPGEEGQDGTFADIDIIYPTEDCAKEYMLEVDRSGVIEITDRGDGIRISAPDNSLCGDAHVVVISRHNPLVKDTLSVSVRREVALVITGRTCGDKGRWTWNRYMSYRFDELYCYVATVSGDIRSAMKSTDKNASYLTFSTLQDGFDYHILLTLERMSGGKIASLDFPYKCLSNARMELTELKQRINGETDRKTRDDDTSYQYYTFRLSNLHYVSSTYRIRYIVHLYKARDSQGWIACKTFSDGYNLEKNKYWYAAADTDEWITEWR